MCGGITKKTSERHQKHRPHWLVVRRVKPFKAPIWIVRAFWASFDWSGLSHSLARPARSCRLWLRPHLSATLSWAPSHIVMGALALATRREVKWWQTALHSRHRRTGTAGLLPVLVDMSAYLRKTCGGSFHDLDCWKTRPTAPDCGPMPRTVLGLASTRESIGGKACDRRDGTPSIRSGLDIEEAGRR